MFNLLRMDFYRLFKGKMFWIFLGIIAVIAVFSSALFGFMNSDVGKELLLNALQSSSSIGVSSGALGSNATDADVLAFIMGSIYDLTQTQYVSQSYIAGGSLLILLYLVASLFTAAEFECGYAKNVFSVRQSKTAYLMSKFIVLLAVTVVYLVFAAALAILGALIAGVDLVPSDLGEWALWFSMSLLIVFAYELIIVAVVWTTRNKVAGVVVAVLLSTNIIGTLFSQVLGFLFPGLEVTRGLLYTSLTATSGGAAGIESLGVVTIVLVGVVYGVIAGVVGLLALKRRDV